MTVVAVVDRTRGEEVVLEAARRAEETGVDLHVAYVLEMGWLATLELTIGERLGIPVGLDVIRELCAKIADDVAAPVVEEYESVGFVGDPADRISEYAASVDADCVVVSGRVGWKPDVFGTGGDAEERLRDEGVTVVPV